MIFADTCDGGRDTSRPYLLKRKAYGGQRPLPPLILEGELITTAFDGQRSSNHKSGGRKSWDVDALPLICGHLRQIKWGFCLCVADGAGCRMLMGK